MQVKGAFEWAVREDESGIHFTQMCIIGECPGDRAQAICCAKRVALGCFKTLTGEIIRSGQCYTCKTYYCARGHVMRKGFIEWAVIQNVKGKRRLVGICVTNECGNDHFKVWPERLGRL